MGCSDSERERKKTKQKNIKRSTESEEQKESNKKRRTEREQKENNRKRRTQNKHNRYIGFLFLQYNKTQLSSVWRRKTFCSLQYDRVSK